jgi:hypothetical protein
MKQGNDGENAADISRLLSNQDDLMKRVKEEKRQMKQIVKTVNKKTEMKLQMSKTPSTGNGPRSSSVRVMRIRKDSVAEAVKKKKDEFGELDEDDDVDIHNLVDVDSQAGASNANNSPEVSAKVE